MESEKRRPTCFEGRVYAAVEEVPYGRVATYRSLAHHLGCRSAQAVGQALKRNPSAPKVPCYRVIRVDGSLGGYVERDSGDPVAEKRSMLEREGVRFDFLGRLASTECLWCWSD